MGATDTAAVTWAEADGEILEQGTGRDHAEAAQADEGHMQTSIPVPVAIATGGCNKSSPGRKRSGFGWLCPAKDLSQGENRASWVTLDVRVHQPSRGLALKRRYCNGLSGCA
jgi:hypothetical protein